MRHTIDEMQVGPNFYVSCVIEITSARHCPAEPDVGDFVDYYEIEDFDIVSDITIMTDSGAVAIASPDIHWKETISREIDWLEVEALYKEYVQ